MSDNWKNIQCGDNVTGRDTLGLPRMGRAIEISPGNCFSVQIEAESGRRYWLSDKSIQACVFQSPKYFCASRQPKEGHELMLVQREGEVVLTKDGKDLLKFVNGQEGFVVLEG